MRNAKNLNEEDIYSVLGAYKNLKIQRYFLFTN